MTKRLLILACSQRKRPNSGLLPAIERYDGGSYRVLRKAMQGGYWGDYKGWIFQYKKRNEILNSLLNTFTTNHLAHFEHPAVDAEISVLKRIISLRSSMTERKKHLSKVLNSGRRELRAKLGILYQEVIQNIPHLAARFKRLMSHGLLKPNEKSFVNHVLNQLDRLETEDAQRLLANATRNRKNKEAIDTIDKRIEQTNILLLKRFKRFEDAGIELPENIQEAYKDILEIVQKSEQELRLTQVRHKISAEILDRAYL